ncbi:hypothetical protein SK128_014567, partial [Halocaridina rubra]
MLCKPNAAFIPKCHVARGMSRGTQLEMNIRKYMKTFTQKWRDTSHVPRTTCVPLNVFYSYHTTPRRQTTKEY